MDHNPSTKPTVHPLTNHDAPGQRPLSMAWISEPLLARTIEFWSARYGRPISEREAVEILMNVKRLGELMLKIQQEDRQE